MAEITNIQKRILNKAIKEPDFSNFIKNLEIDVFEGNNAFETVFNSLSDYYREHKEPATKDVLETYLQGKLDRKKIPENERNEYSEAISSVFTVESNKDKQVFDEIITEHIKSKRIMNAITQIALAGATDSSIKKFDDTYLRIKKEAMAAEKEAIINVTSSEDSSLISEYIDNVGAGIVKIPVGPYQEATGGLGKGELGLIGADSGAGKSLALVSLAVEYVLQGKTVMYFDLEELPGRKFMRFYKAMLGRIAKEVGINNETVKGLIGRTEASAMFKNGQFNVLLKKYSEKTGNPTGKLLFTRHNPHTLSTSGMRQEVENMTMVNGEDIDVIFVDYPDLLRLNTGDDIYRSVGIMFEELRAIAQEYEAIMWTATQLGRKSDKGSDIRTGNDIQGSIQKKNAVEFLGIINLKTEERDSGYGRIYIDKTRNGTNTGQMVPFKMDTLTGLVRAETEEEALEHEAILATRNNSAPTREDKGLGKDNQPKDYGGIF